MNVSGSLLGVHVCPRLLRTLEIVTPIKNDLYVWDVGSQSSNVDVASDVEMWQYVEDRCKRVHEMTTVQFRSPGKNMD